MIENALKIEGWMNDDELEWLANTAKRCSTIVEFGCYKGRSTRVLGDNTSGVVYAVDPWNGRYYFENGTPCPITTPDDICDFVFNLRDLIIARRVIPCCMHSYEFTLNRKADFVFIDGDHRYRAVVRDINVARELIGPNGIIAGHDYARPDWPGVKQAVDEEFGDMIHVINSIWWVTGEK